jgi:hypothetical protein
LRDKNRPEISTVLAPLESARAVTTSNGQELDTKPLL